MNGVESMIEEEYVIVKISKTDNGLKEELIDTVPFEGKNGLTDEFKDTLLDEYSIDVDELLKECENKKGIIKTTWNKIEEMKQWK